MFFTMLIIHGFISMAQAAPLRIMPLGDSITAGGYNENGQWKVGGGYRVKLDTLLKQQGLDFVFVGGLHDGPEGFTNNAHEGHSGFRVEQLTSGVQSWLQAAKPDLILLMVGTNDIIQNYDLDHVGMRFEALLNVIEQTLPNAKLIVASSIPTENEDWNEKLEDLAHTVEGMVVRHSRAGHSIQFVDMYSLSGIEHNRNDLIDGVHPTPLAYDKLAPVWASAIQKGAWHLFVAGTR